MSREENRAGDFMEKVLSLDASSTKEQIRECLLYDMKRLACLSPRNTEVFLDTCASAGVNISLEYAAPNEGLAALKNWLRYKIAADRKLHAVPFDGDKSTPVLEAFGLLLRSVSAEVVSTGDRHFSVRLVENAPAIALETDTVNSLATTFSRFLQEILTSDGVEADYAANYRAAFGLSGRAYDRSLLYSYCLSRLDEWYESPRLTGEGRLFFDLFIKLAERSHVLGNFALVPAGYNVGRYPRSKDYWDLTLRDLQNFYLYISNFNIFDSFDGSLKPELCLPSFSGAYVSGRRASEPGSEGAALGGDDAAPSSEGAALGGDDAAPSSEGAALGGESDFAFFAGHDFAEPIPGRENMAECLENMIRLIEARGLNILRRLNGKLSGNAAFAEMLQDAAGGR